jgi:heme/copper-type cytochrome/quinol oxidase subunit 2
MALRRLSGAVLLAVLVPTAVGAAPLDPAVVEAQRVADFFWWMALIAAIVWFAALGLLAYCLRTPVRPAPARRRVVIGGGVVLPTLLVVGLGGGIVPHTHAVETAVTGDALGLQGGVE